MHPQAFLVEMDSNGKNKLPIFTIEDTISPKQTAGDSPFELQFGQQAILPISIEINTSLDIEWNKISAAEELLEARAINISAKEETEFKAVDKLRDQRNK
ncbi:hypothetical protein O181_035326 [Austropuccinia psidii MF-1]|uniref:Uncharacterized protein n=1 Tax=Austropuccinia psidii MF-1 TaxID=1389203 RepID=A0A9Q3H8V2_9BASI|nr:hypothetical protein [Austropuccinia psidii MF-1]